MGREAVSPLHNFQLCALSILLLCDSYQSLQATIRLIIVTITQLGFNTTNYHHQCHFTGFIISKKNIFVLSENRNQWNR